MTTLDDVVAAIESFDARLVVFARWPWAGDGEAFVARAGRDGFEIFCGVGGAQERPRHYVGDPPAMRLARVVAWADVLRARRLREARELFFEGALVAVFKEAPTESGRWRFEGMRHFGPLRREVARSGVAACRLGNVASST